MTVTQQQFSMAGYFGFVLLGGRSEHFVHLEDKEGNATVFICQFQ